MRSYTLKTALKTAVLTAGILLLPGAIQSSAQSVSLTAGPANATLPDGQTVPMWGYTCGSGAAAGGATCAPLNPNAGTGWSPVLITVPSSPGSLKITLTNNLVFTTASTPNNIPTSLVIVGQLGGGLGLTASKVDSPIHPVQGVTWPTVGGTSGATFTPPSQPQRVQSFSTEVAAGTTTASPLTWSNLKPGTYLIESGTHPSIQAPMGLFGVLVVTTAPVAGTSQGVAYPNVNYDADVPMLLSEIDPAQNRAVDAAVRTAGFSETATVSLNDDVTSIILNSGGGGYTDTPTVTLTGGGGTGATATATLTAGAVTSITVTNPGKGYTSVPTVTFSSIAAPTTPASATAVLRLATSLPCGSKANACYPPAVNYSPLYYAINGVAFNKTSPGNSSFPITAPAGTGQVLVRFVNAGLRMHVPSIVGSTTGNAAVPGFSLIAEDGNPLPGTPRVQNEVFLAAGKTYDVMINAPPSAALPVFDRQLSLSANNQRDGGMLAYINVNSAQLPVAGVTAAAGSTPLTYYCFVGNPLTVSDPTLGLLSGAKNAYGLTFNPATGWAANNAGDTLVVNPDGTFTYTPVATTPAATTCGGQINYSLNGTVAATATIIQCTQGAGCLTAGPTANPDSYTSNVALQFAAGSPGVLANDFDPSGHPLKAALVANSASGGTVTLNPDGSFTAAPSSPPTGSAPATVTFSYNAVNSQGTASSASALVTVTFLPGSGLAVNVLDAPVSPTGGSLVGTSGGAITDYRWIIEEDRTFHVDPTKETGATGTVPSLGTNFHTSYMPVVASGCVGTVACESGQMIVDPTSGSHNPAVCDIGNGVCRTSAAQQTPVDPKYVHLDPTKHYYISILPGDAGNSFISGGGVVQPVDPTNPGGAKRPFSIPTDCGLYNDPTKAANWTPGSGKCGHGMGGAPIGAGQQAVNVLLQETPFQPAKISVFVYEDDWPLNGENDAGGGVDILAPLEPGLGGFEIRLWDDAGGSGDATGQMTYDMFNMPLSNSLQGTMDPATGNDACPISPTTDGLLGRIVTCPRLESDGKTLSPLAGQAVIANMMPGRYGVQATEGGDRFGKGEEWIQTNTLDGQKAHDSFIKIGGPAYFQEFGPAGFHVMVGFANPAIINARLKPICTGGDGNLTGTNCSNIVQGTVTEMRQSHPPDQRLYSSTDNTALNFTQCYVSLGDPDGEDFAFGKCDSNGHFKLSGIPEGSWRLTVFDQWNDQIVDGLSTPVGITGGGNTVDFDTNGGLAVQQWHTNFRTSTYFDTNGNGVRDPGEPGLALVPTNIRYRDGSYSNFNNTDLNGNAGYNEVFPLFNWYVIDTDTTRYKQTGVHVVYDSGGPADGTPGGNTSAIANKLASTKEPYGVPTNLRVPGAVYCGDADCANDNLLTYPHGGGPGGSTGRIDPPWVTSEAWQGFIGQYEFLEFGKAPFVPGENGGIHGEVIYASTRPFDNPQLLVHTSWTPDVPNVTVNLYQTTAAADGTQTLTLVDTTKTSSWDDWAQGFRSDGIPNMNCPGQTGPGDPFYFTLKDTPFYLDQYNNGSSYTALPNDSQYKCYDGLHNFNQVQPAPYDGAYQFPSVNRRDTTTGLPVNGPPVAISSATEVGNVVTVTTGAAHGLKAGNAVIIAGMAPSGFNGKYIVSTVTSSTTFTYSDPATSLTETTLGTASVAGSNCTICVTDPANATAAPAVAIASLTQSGGLVTATLGAAPSASAVVGENVTVQGVLDAAPVTITSISQDSTGLVTVSYTGTLPLIAGNNVLIQGVTTTGYNGTFPVSTVGSGTFSYIDLGNTGLAADTTGTAAALDPGYNGTFTIYAVPSSTSIQYISPVVNLPALTAQNTSATPTATLVGATLPDMLPMGKYVVEVIVPPGYELVKEEDKNILIGDNYIAPVTQQFAGLGNVFILPDQASLAFAYNMNNAQNPTDSIGRFTFPTSEGDTHNLETFWPCVGEQRIVPDYISLFPGSQQVSPFAGATRPLCDRKEVMLGDQTAALAKFWIFSSTHVAAHFTGFILDDLSSEFDPFSPQFGEKFAVPNLPVSIKDFAGNEVERVYTDQWGVYNGLNYSTWEVNPPNPTGYAPTMMVACMNDPGTGPTRDPYFNPSYSQFCYEIPYMPGQTQYMDTPVVPTAAFAEGYNPADCAYPDATPAISEVDGDSVGGDTYGPWVNNAGGAVASINLVNPGSGYTSAPTVTFTPATAPGITATATATVIGSVASVTVNNGGQYASAPSVTISGGGGSGASATASISGSVSSVAVNSGGAGYTTAPVVTTSGGGGSGASVKAVLSASGSIVNVTITNGGSGYTTAPKVTFPYIANFPTPASATANLGTGATAGKVVSVTITNPGSGYTNTPGVHFDPAPAGGTNATGSPVRGFAVDHFTISSGGSGYSSAPAITVANPPATSQNSAVATGTATDSYTVSAVTIAPGNGGSGYTGTPTVSFSGGGQTAPAHATAVVSYTVTGLNLTNSGSGYTSAPTVTFSAPAIGTNGATANATLATGGTLIIKALGDVNVPNPAYSGPNATAAPFNQKFVKRHYGFGGAQGTVTIGGVTAPIMPGQWSDTQITAMVPSTVPSCANNGPLQRSDKLGNTYAAQCGELVITAANGQQSIDAVTVTVGGKAPTHVQGENQSSNAIQQTIDKAAPGDLIIVDPGTYSEMLLMWKPVRLQGVGAASSIINANTHPSGKLDPWRRQVACLFGLALNGALLNPGGGQPATPYDPTGVYSSLCPAGGDPTDPTYQQGKVDPLPLEGIVGWDTTLNGNLAQLLQEPSLMGAYEGAAITVLGKGMSLSIDGSSLATAPGGGTEGDFPAGAVPLTASNSDCNNFPSNFWCNPSRIDGLSLTDSSQGGGGVFVHAWNQYLEIANNRIYGNAGTLSGGINMGQGESPDGVLATDNSIVNVGQELPFMYEAHTLVHNNAITANSSYGDELFSASPSAAGGVTFCTGADYYKFDYNWVCGNLSTGDGGGLVHEGYIVNGEIKHNWILFNQSNNITLPTNGGGITVLGASPDGNVPGAPAGTECGNTITDADCAPGLSDGTGPNLVIDSNVIMGNTAESGSGGGIRLQLINGTDVQNLPNQPGLWNSVSLTNNIIANNVAGWDGGGVSLQDALNVSIINNTITRNDTTASSGVLFNTLGAPNGSTPPPGCDPSVNPTCIGSTVTTSTIQPAGLVSMAHTANLATAFKTLGAGGFTCPANHPNCDTISNPILANDLFWQNRAFNIVVGDYGSGGQNQQHLVILAPSLNQKSTGDCETTGNNTTGSTNVTFWDIGGRGDSGPGTHESGITLAPTYSILTNASETGNGANVLTGNPALASPYCNGSRVPPENGGFGYNVPPGISDATVPNPIFNLTPAATVDEGNNWINMAYGPLSLANPTLAPINLSTIAAGTANGNYEISVGSIAINAVPNTASTYNEAPSVDILGTPRKTNNHVDIGAFEYQAVAPVLNSISPNTGARGNVVAVTLSGLHFTGATAVGVSGTGITVGALTITDTTITTTFTIATNNTATLGARNVTVTTPGGTTAPVTFTVVNPAPTLTNVNPSSGIIGTAPTVTLTGTNFTTNGTTVAVNGTGIGVSNVTIVSPTSITATFTVNPGSAGNHSVTVTTPGGTTSPVAFGVFAPTLTGISPASFLRGATNVTVTLTGTHLTGATGLVISNPASDVTVGALNVTDTSITTTFTISATATLGSRTVRVTTPNGTTGTAAFTITNPPPPVLSSIAPNSGIRGTNVPVVFTGTGMTGVATVTVSGTGVSLLAGSIHVVNSATVNATLVIAATASATTRTITVSNAFGASNPVNFTVNNPPVPTLTGLSQSTAYRGTAPTVTLTGTGFTGATGVTINSNNGVNIANLHVVNDTTATATFTVSSGATLSARTVTITTLGGTSGSQPLTILGPSLTSISPVSRAASPVTVTLTGVDFAGASAIGVTGGGISVSNIQTVNSTTVTATFTITPTASLAVRNVNLATTNGSTNLITFTLVP